MKLFLESEVIKTVSNNIDNCHEEIDAGHGRIELRKCIVSSQIDWLEAKRDWPGLKTIIMLEETRDIANKQTTERRFFMSSLPANAKQISYAIRAHWLVENALHWTLDVVFNEDNSRVRKQHAGQNMALIRHVVLNMLNTAKKHYKGVALKALRKNSKMGKRYIRVYFKTKFLGSI